MKIEPPTNTNRHAPTRFIGFPVSDAEFIRRLLLATLGGCPSAALSNPATTIHYPRRLQSGDHHSVTIIHYPRRLPSGDHQPVTTIHYPRRLPSGDHQPVTTIHYPQRLPFGGP